MLSRGRIVVGVGIMKWRDASPLDPITACCLSLAVIHAGDGALQAPMSDTSRFVVTAVLRFEATTLETSRMETGFQESIAKQAERKRFAHASSDGLRTSHLQNSCGQDAHRTVRPLAIQADNATRIRNTPFLESSIVSSQ